MQQQIRDDITDIKSGHNASRHANETKLTSLADCGASQNASYAIHTCYMQVLWSAADKVELQTRATIKIRNDSLIGNTVVEHIKYFPRIVC